MAPSTTATAPRRTSRVHESAHRDWARPAAWVAAIGFCLAAWVGVALVVLYLL